MRRRTHTRSPLHDTIGPSSVTATGITGNLAMLVTTQYGRVAEWVHVQDRPVAAGLDANLTAKAPVAGLNGSTCHDAARQAAVHSPVRVTLAGLTSVRPTAANRSADSPPE